MSETMAINQTYVCKRAVISTSSVERYVCLSAPADWDVFSAIKAFPRVSISNLPELERPADHFTELCFLNNVTREATVTSSFNLKPKWKNTPCGFRLLLCCMLAYKSVFVILQSSD